MTVHVILQSINYIIMDRHFESLLSIFSVSIYLLIFIDNYKYS